MICGYLKAKFEINYFILNYYLGSYKYKERNLADLIKYWRHDGVFWDFTYLYSTEALPRSFGHKYSFVTDIFAVQNV